VVNGEAALEMVLPADCAGLRLDQALAALFPQHSRSRLSAWVKAGRVTLDGSPSTPSHKVWGGEKAAVAPLADPRVTSFRAQDIPIDVVFEDDTLMVINKPAGLVVHPGSGNWDGTLLNALLQHAPTLENIPRAGIVHRLDKDTSGLLVVAKSLTAQTALVRQLQDHSVTREYIALVHGIVAHAGHVDAPIGRHQTQRTRMAVTPHGKPAITHYDPLEHLLQTTLLRCRLETGRTHQIRVHLASIGHPIVGDPVYGTQRKTPAFTRQALHAEKLALTHPTTGRRRSWTARVPADMRKLITGLRKAT
jgi:23S rRNA pseudouridine1911/1915/1917 synthase